jgi:hypothetical protein
VNHINKDEITHVAHIDIDEYIVLKKHDNIKDFIAEYIKDDCVGIGMNWRFFGSDNNNTNVNVPVPLRFTKCEAIGNHHIKTIFDKRYFVRFNECHSIQTHPGTFIKATNGSPINGPFNNNIDFSIVQLNHYKCKTWDEFKYIRTRQRADIKGDIHENIEESFKTYDNNEVEELTCHDYFIRKLLC